MGTVALRAELDVTGVVLPQPCQSIASMISVNERKLLYHLVRDHYRGAGFIVDGGIWLGSSTLAFGLGIMNRPDAETLLRPFKARTAKPIHGYDLCIATPHMIQFLEEDGHPLAGALREGEDFSDVTAEQLSSVEPIVELHVGDLLDFGWNADDPVEILFIDVAKTLSLHKHILAQFMPALIPGAYLIQQDFYFAQLPWIKVTMAHLRDHFEFLGEAHATAIFRCIDTNWGDKLVHDPWDEAGLDDLLHLHDSWLDTTTDRRRRAMMELSSALLMTDRKAYDRALERLRHIETEYADILAIDRGYASLEEKLQNTRALVMNEAEQAGGT